MRNRLLGPIIVVLLFALSLPCLAVIGYRVDPASCSHIVPENSDPRSPTFVLKDIQDAAEDAIIMAHAAKNWLTTAAYSPTSPDGLRIAYVTYIWLATYPGQRLWEEAKGTKRFFQHDQWLIDDDRILRESGQTHVHLEHSHHHHSLQRGLYRPVALNATASHL